MRLRKPKIWTICPFTEKVHQLWSLSLVLIYIYRYKYIDHRSIIDLSRYIYDISIYDLSVIDLSITIYLWFIDYLSEMYLYLCSIYISMINFSIFQLCRSSYLYLYIYDLSELYTMHLWLIYLYLYLYIYDLFISTSIYLQERKRRKILMI